ncbi:hypothetical protein NTE_02342 [Candidatus Nitrososphaera evergladensis SR1]|uniref:Uncharacterized protein n=1 Tax=Candidatus Nitrososphaera evergladensis SR1 TaxID=1459636 RepID=A0A075MYQ3_9ARCH|nr:hypothetical protein [Candidatus Nitrososphaera evergladensis]AIF84394.1 hypothetical protein NTE_02342 [Candidatus Nitrososphaera evergladensis SR1]
MRKSASRGILYLVAYCILGFYTFFTAMYHMADLAARLGLDTQSNPVAFVALKFRASMDCRDYVAQTSDESCYLKWHV